MSSSIAIPKRKGKGPAHDHRNSSSSSSFAASTGPSTPNNYNYNFTPSPNRFSYGSGGSPRSYGSSTPSSSSSSLPSGSSPQTSASSMRRRESLMSETFSRQEHTVVNVGGDEEGEGASVWSSLVYRFTGVSVRRGRVGRAWRLRAAPRWDVKRGRGQTGTHNNTTDYLDACMQTMGARRYPATGNVHCRPALHSVTHTNNRVCTPSETLVSCPFASP